MEIKEPETESYEHHWISSTLEFSHAFWFCHPLKPEVLCVRVWREQESLMLQRLLLFARVIV